MNINDRETKHQVKNIALVLIEFLVPTIPQRIIWTAKQGIYSNPAGICEEDLVWYISKVYSVNDILIKAVLKVLMLLPVIVTISIPISFLPGDIGIPIKYWLIFILLFLLVSLGTHFSFVFSNFEIRRGKVKKYLKEYNIDRLKSFQLERHKLLQDEWDRIDSKVLLSNLYV